MAVNIFDRSVKALARRYPQPFVKVTLGAIEDLTVETIENPGGHDGNLTAVRRFNPPPHSQ